MSASRSRDEALKRYCLDANEKVLQIAAEKVLEQDADVDHLLFQLGWSETRRNKGARSNGAGRSTPAVADRRSESPSAGAGSNSGNDGDGKDLTAEDVIRAVLPEAFHEVDPRINEPENFFTGLPEDCDPHIAPCCLPVPKEEIVGVLGRKGRLRIHRSDCQEIHPDEIRCADRQAP